MHRERLALQGFGFAQLAFYREPDCQVSQSIGYPGVLVPQQSLTHRQAVAAALLGFLQIAVLVHQCSSHVL